MTVGIATASVSEVGPGRRGSIDSRQPVRALDVHRLCALAADETKKENVDGEALIWASNCIRLLDRPNKIIVNVTDGFFPIDDSTIFSNSSNPLTLHMAAVCDAIEQDGSISLARVYVDLNDEHAKARQKLRDDGMTIFQRDAVTTEFRDVGATLDAVVEGIELGLARAAELSHTPEEAQVLGPRI